MKRLFRIVVVFMLVAGYVNAEPLITYPKIKISCDTGVRADGYSRLTTNSTSANFSSMIVQQPVPQAEWTLSEPQIVWSITPDAGVSLSSTFPWATLTIFESGKGHSYCVKVAATWTLTNEQSGEKTVASCSASYVLDSVRYSFVMSCSDGTFSLGGEALVDNHPAQTRVTAEGCSRPDLLDLSFSSQPAVDSPLNKAGTAMEFQKKGPLVFNIPKTYWYGTAKPGCCYCHHYPYEVRLAEKTDGEVALKQVVVGWPGEHPEANVDIDPLAYSLTIGDADADGRFVATLVIVGFVLTPCPVDAQDITDQYREETLREEGYHIKQFMGGVSWEEGGEPDIYSVTKIIEYMNANSLTNRVTFRSRKGETKQAFRSRLEQRFMEAQIRERTISEEVLSRNRWYREKKAKEHAGYNAAWMYHCTYEDDAHPEGNIPHVTRQVVEMEVDQ